MTMLGREMSNIESREAAARVALPSGHGPPGPGAGVVTCPHIQGTRGTWLLYRVKRLS